MKKLSFRELAVAGLIAALYTVVSVALMPISFGVYQVRIAEALTVLPMVTRAAIPGLYVGCLLANVFGGMGWLDIVFGPLITLIAAVLTRLVSRLPNGSVASLLAGLPVALIWVCAVYFIASASETWFVIVGAILVIAALVLTLTFSRLWSRGVNVNIFIAPLPPVLLNAFGVSLYLAPLLGFNYWFSVQMIGVGQLIACYLIGLPILITLQRRQLPFRGDTTLTSEIEQF
ncbi:MAG TPA: QueT transporter family protein [Candidatus Deferrimicrobium sp.]|nr:QueT transporter family protein [Candidatus Deferrimicrobium sp.]